MLGLQYCFCAQSRQLFKLVKKLAMLRALTVRLYFLWLCLVKLTLFFTEARLKVFSMIVFDREIKVLDTEIFPQHNIADLNSGITLVLFSQERPLWWKGINTHTHTHTRTRACAHILNEWLTDTKISFAEVYNALAFPKLLTCRSHSLEKEHQKSVRRQELDKIVIH